MSGWAWLGLANVLFAVVNLALILALWRSDR